MGPGRLTLRKRTSIANELCFFHKDLFLYFSVNILLRGRKSTFIKNNRLLRFTMATMLWKLLWPVSSEKAEQTHIRQEYITVNLLRLTAYYIFYIEFFFKESAKTPNTLSTFTIFNEFHKKISSLSSDDATIQLIWLWEFCWKTFFDGRLRLYLVNSLPFEKTNETAVCLWNFWISINYHHRECIFYQFKWH